MGNMANQLKVAMLAQLRASDLFAEGVDQNLYEREEKMFPSAWIGVSEADPLAVCDIGEFLATLHIWGRVGGGTSAGLIDHAKLVLQDPPLIEGRKVTYWRSEFSECRLDDDQGAYRGLIRFRCMMVIDCQLASGDISPSLQPS